MSPLQTRLRCLALILTGIAVSACSRGLDAVSPSQPAQPPPPATYTVSVMVSGLTGTGLVLQNNGAGDSAVSANGSVTFASQSSGAAYAITVLTQPATPAQTCVVANGTGTVAQANVTNVTVTCTNNFTPSYVPAPPGDPQGTATTQLIDAAGGSISSSDGRVTLNIPASALTSATTISIQPITATSPNALGLGFRLQPEGTTFAVPATLTFHLSSTETIGIDSTIVVTQHADGLWYSQPNQLRDANAQTVSVKTSHFSDWEIAGTLILRPAAQRVKIGQTADFTATIMYVNLDEVALEDPEVEVELPQSVPLEDQFINATKTWSVNSIPGGNSEVGQISDPGHYVAPAQVPSPSRVAVALTAQIGNTKVVAPADVDLYSQEIWSGTTDMTQIDGTTYHATITFIEKTSDTDPNNAHFEVQSGTVTITIPPVSTTGCPQTIDPASHTIAPAEGSMTVTYDAASGSQTGVVSGGGTTVWPVTMKEMCPNGTLTLTTSAQAQWWPVDLAIPNQTYPVVNGAINAQVSTPLVTGSVNLTRQ